MMTFLEFVCRRLIGRPSGSSLCRAWRCPSCQDGKRTLTVRPPKGNYRIRFKCHKCQWWGDEADMMRHFHPTENYPQHRARLDLWHEEYQRDVEAGTLPDAGGPAPALSFSPRSPGTTPPPVNPAMPAEQREALETALDKVRDALSAEERRALVRAARLAADGEVPLQLLAEDCACYEEWLVWEELGHQISCPDWGCPRACCRACRGLPPSMPEVMQANGESHRRNRKNTPAGPTGPTGLTGLRRVWGHPGGRRHMNGSKEADQ